MTIIRKVYYKQYMKNWNESSQGRITKKERKNDLQHANNPKDKKKKTLEKLKPEARGKEENWEKQKEH